MFDPMQFAKDAAEATQPAEAFGRLKISQTCKIFNGKGVPPREVPRAELDKANRRDRAIEATFEVDGSEFDPSRTWTYSRKVRLGSKDWTRTVAPSIVATFGSVDRLREGAYVHVVDVPQIENEQFNTAKFVEVFESAEACARAWAEKTGKKAPNGSTNGQVPLEFVETARAVRQAVPDDATFISVIKADAKLSPYADQLIELLKTE